MFLISGLLPSDVLDICSLIFGFMLFGVSTPDLIGELNPLQLLNPLAVLETVGMTIFRVKGPLVSDLFICCFSKKDGLGYIFLLV